MKPERIDFEEAKNNPTETYDELTHKAALIFC
jgi:hypothetical protein